MADERTRAVELVTGILLTGSLLLAGYGFYQGGLHTPDQVHYRNATGWFVAAGVLFALAALTPVFVLVILPRMRRGAEPVTAPSGSPRATDVTIAIPDADPVGSDYMLGVEVTNHGPTGRFRARMMSFRGLTSPNRPKGYGNFPLAWANVIGEEAGITHARPHLLWPVRWMNHDDWGVAFLRPSTDGGKYPLYDKFIPHEPFEFTLEIADTAANTPKEFRLRCDWDRQTAVPFLEVL